MLASETQEDAHGPPMALPYHPTSEPSTEPSTQHRSGEDIYRGELPCPPKPGPDSVSASSSFSSPPFSTGRLGALAAVVELAITRWARANQPSSSSVLSRSSSKSSIPQFHTDRRAKRRLSTNDLQSECDIAARIKARQESRRSPREFAIFLPPSQTDSDSPHTQHEQNAVDVLRTTSLSLILNRLERVMKKPSEVPLDRDALLSDGQPMGSSRIPSLDRPSHLHFMLPDHVKDIGAQTSSFNSSHRSKDRKGKGNGQFSTCSAVVTAGWNTGNLKNKAWWLDVSNPTFDDMRSIGKLLHLHPLTLEDILQQESCEKLELFPKLGYYFIIFRAIESQSIRRRTLYGTESAKFIDEGDIGETNVYVVVFRGGICSFHFTDICEHTDRVRHRILLLEAVNKLSSDWITHGILDSIVDSFFPFLEEVEREVAVLEDIVFSTGRDTVAQNQTDIDESNVALSRRRMQTVIDGSGVEKVDDAFHEKHSDAKQAFPPKKAQLSFVHRVISRMSRLILVNGRSFGLCRSTNTDFLTPPCDTTSTLRRIARTRRLVTSLSRLLATKSEVVLQIKKRLLGANEPAWVNGIRNAEDTEVAMYMGDIQDHILTLQHSLVHYERILSQSHLVYLFYLSNATHSAKSSIDKRVMVLSMLSMAVLCIGPLIGVFSMNVQMPHNELDPGHPFNVFGIVIFLAFLVLSAYVLTVQRWMKQTKKRNPGKFN